MSFQRQIVAPKFAPESYPFQQELKPELRCDEMHFILPYSMFKPGARAWSEIKVDQTGVTNFALLQFIGEMMKHAQFLGTEEGFCIVEQGANSYTVRQKVYFIVSLISKVTEAMTINLSETMSIEKLTETSNRACVLISIISTDPMLRIIDLIRCQVGENAAAREFNRRTLLDNEINCMISKIKMVNGVLQNRHVDPDPDPDPSVDNQQVVVAPPIQISSNRRTNPHRAMPTRSSNKQPSTGISVLYREFDRLQVILGYLIDMTQAGTSTHNIVSNESFSSRPLLDAAIDSDHPDPRVDIKRILSLDSVLKHAISSKIVEHINTQLDANKYYHDPIGDLFGDDRQQSTLSFPIPELVWQMDISQCSAFAFATMAFPWSTLSPLQKYARIVSRHMDITVTEAINGITTFSIPKSYLSNELVLAETDNTKGGRDAYTQENGIFLPLTKRRNTGRSSIAETTTNSSIDISKVTTIATDARLGDLSLIDQSGSYKVFKNPLRELGAITKNATELCRILELYDIKRLKRTNGDTHISTEGQIGNNWATSTVPCSTFANQSYQAARKKCMNAIESIQKTALEDCEGMLDPSSSIPDNLKGCVNWIEQRVSSMELPFRVHSKNIGPFGNMITSLLCMTRQLGIASNNYPLLFLVECVHSLGPAWAASSLPANPFISAIFESGKSHLLKLASALCIKGYCDLAHGSSQKGQVARGYVNEDGDHVAPGECMLYNDELKFGQTAARGKTSGDEFDACAFQAAAMTHTGANGAGIEYHVIAKEGDTLRSQKEITDTIIGIGGATNADAHAINAIKARMINVDVLPAGSVSRSAIKSMLASQTPDFSIRCKQVWRGCFILIVFFYTRYFFFPLIGYRDLSQTTCSYNYYI